MENLKMIKPQMVQNIINRFCYTIGMLPTSYKLSLTYEEQLLVIGRFLEETVIPALNNNAAAVVELQELFIELQDFVNNYFDNVNIQNQINNKLDEMAKDGTLSDIIAEYVKLQGILAYNNINDMKTATNLVDGSFTRTYGYNSLNDGYGAFYKIRNIENTDIVDNINIIALSNPSLVAVLMIDKNFEDLKQNVESNSNSIINIQQEVNKNITDIQFLLNSITYTYEETPVGKYVNGKTIYRRGYAGTTGASPTITIEDNVSRYDMNEFLGYHGTQNFSFDQNINSCAIGKSTNLYRSIFIRPCNFKSLEKWTNITI